MLVLLVWNKKGILGDVRSKCGGYLQRVWRIPSVGLEMGGTRSEALENLIKCSFEGCGMESEGRRDLRGTITDSYNSDDIGA